MYAEVDGCSSDTSGVLNIEVFEIPDIPNIQTNTPVCEGELIILDTDSIPDPSALYFWSGPSNFNSTLRSPKITATPNLEGIYSLVVEVAGCSSLPATEQVQVIDLDNPPLVSNEGPVCLDDPDACVRLTVDPNTAINGSMYSWFLADDPDVVICGPTPGLICTICDLSGFQSGFSEFFLVATATGCETEPSLPTVVEFQTRPNESADAGQDIRLCGESAATLNASIPSPGIAGIWTQTCGPPAVIGNPNSPVTTVSSLSSAQEYCFVWTLDFESLWFSFGVGSSGNMDPTSNAGITRC
jgi:hypothetical protein